MAIGDKEVKELLQTEFARNVTRVAKEGNGALLPGVDALIHYLQLLRLQRNAALVPDNWREFVPIKQRLEWIIFSLGMMLDITPPPGAATWECMLEDLREFHTFIVETEKMKEDNADT